jgi:signal transduction histidine kinase
MLATLFVFALWLDFDPLFDRGSTVAFLLAGYVLFALALVAATWNDWWLDARLAGPAHAVDIIVFTALIAFTDGYDSPYFTFFTFLLLAAAIRWGWRATTLTAILLMALFLTAGMVVSGPGGRSTVHDFVDRTGHLVILSFVLIWFGINRWRAGMHPHETTAFTEAVLDESPVATGLRAGMHAAGAETGVLVWREHGENHADVYIARAGDVTLAQMSGKAVGAITTPFLYDLQNDRALTRDELRNLRGMSARALIQEKAAKEFRLGEGLAVPIKAGSGEGELFLEDLTNLSVDHIDIGESIASDIVGLVERHALMIAVEESAEARSRLTLARDLHDSVVQFLAGTAFRLEALKRDLSAGRDVQPDLNHLKQLMLQEQGELRSFIAALRSAPQIDLDDLAQDLRALASRLAQQWDVFCDFSAETTEMMVPTRLQLDTQHLVREAVANAVRHAGAKSVTIKLRAEAQKLKLDFINDGSRYPNSPLTGELPRSLSERVKLAGGALELSRGMGVTRISVSLPIGRVN